MSVFLTVLSVIGAVIGGILTLILIVFLVLLPIKAEIDTGYNKDDGFFLRVKYFAFSYGIFPKQERKKNNKEKPEETDGKPDEGSEQSEKKEDKEKKTKKESLLEKRSDSSECPIILLFSVTLKTCSAKYVSETFA